MYACHWRVTSVTTAWRVVSSAAGRRCFPWAHNRQCHWRPCHLRRSTQYSASRWATCSPELSTKAYFQIRQPGQRRPTGIRKRSAFSLDQMPWQPPENRIKFQRRTVLVLWCLYDSLRRPPGAVSLVGGKTGSARGSACRIEHHVLQRLQGFDYALDHIVHLSDGCARAFDARQLAFHTLL